MAKDKTPKRRCGDPSSTILIDHSVICRPSHWSSTARVAHQGRRSWGWEVLTPVKVCWKAQSMFWPPWNVKFFHSKLLLYNCKFHNVKDKHLDIITSLILLMLTTIPSYFWSAPGRQYPPINAFAALLDTYRGQRQNSKTWVQMTRHQQSS